MLIQSSTYPLGITHVICDFIYLYICETKPSSSIPLEGHFQLGVFVIVYYGIISVYII